MPFQPINFANIDPQGQPWIRDFVKNLSEGYKAGQMPAKMERERQQEMLANALAQFNVEKAPEKFRSEMDSAETTRDESRATTNKTRLMTPYEVEKAKQFNDWYGRDMQSQIDARKALDAYRQSGAGGLGAGGKEEMLFQSFIGKDNPQLKPEQLYEASNVIRMGGNTLADGTKLNPLSPASRGAYDRIVKYGTTSPIITQNVMSSQADKEIQVMSNYINKGIAPFGTTYFGLSPAQIMANFSNKKEDQIKLGRLIASNQLQADLAALQNKINSGQSTASITKEILESSEQKISSHWPRMTNEARQEASRYLTEALGAALEARQKVPIGAGASTGAYNRSNESSGEPTLVYNPQTGKVEKI